MMNSRCRMYAERYPSVNDFVTVKIKSMTDIGFQVELLEYGHAEGLILMSEASRQSRVRVTRNLLRVNKVEVVKVLRVDEEKGFIDLSKRLAFPDALVEQEQKFAKSKAVHSIMAELSALCSTPVLELYEQFGWDLYRRYPHAEDGLRMCQTNPALVLSRYQLPESLYQQLLICVQRRFPHKFIKVRAEIEVTCFAYEGIDAIKTALKAGEACGTVEVPIKIQLLAPPRYLMTSQTSQPTATAFQVLQRACEKIQEVITPFQGLCQVVQVPYLVTNKEEEQLSKRLQALNEEIEEEMEDSISIEAPI